MTGNLVVPQITFTGYPSNVITSNMNGLVFSTDNNTALTIGIDGSFNIPHFTTNGVLHMNSNGNLTNSLIVNSDISSSAGISNEKLAIITTAGLVSNSATTATNLNTASAIVARDITGNFSAGTITADIIGNLTGNASGNLPTIGGTMTGALTLISGNTTTPAINFTGSKNAGLSATSGALSLITNNLERFNVSSSGTISINGFVSSGIVHNNAFGNLTSSLIVASDISPSANIANESLATITQIGLVSNSATTATNINTANAIVARDSLGGFSAGTITANLTGNVTGNASGNLLLTGGILTGALTLPNGTLLAPSLAFTSSSNTGLASVNANTLSLITNGVERILISSTGKTTLGDINIKTFNTAGILHNDSSGNITTSAVNLATETTGTLPNSSTTATNLNTASAIVARDINGNFSASTITANLNGSVALQSISMWIGSSFSGTVCLFTANTNKGFTNRNSPSSTNGGFTNWIYTGIYEITFSGSLYNTGSGTFVENIALNGTPVISTTIDDSKGGEDYYTFNISCFVGINSLTDVVSCTTTGLTTSLPNLLHCSIKYLGT
jgi:hypothetical protein